MSASGGDPPAISVFALSGFLHDRLAPAVLRDKREKEAAEARVTELETEVDLLKSDRSEPLYAFGDTQPKNDGRHHLANREVAEPLEGDL